MKYVLTIPVVLLVVTFALFTSIYLITIPWKPVFASPDTLTLRPNAAGTYQVWGTFGAPPSHWEGTSDQNDATGVQSPTGSTAAKETEHLQDTTQTGTINSVTAYMRAKESGETIEYEQITYVGSTSATGNNPTSGSFTLPSGWQANDFCIFWWYTYADTKTFVHNVGQITQKYNTSSSGYGRLFIGYRILQTGDTTFSWTSSSVTSSTTIWGVSVFRNVDTTNPWDTDSGTPITFTDAVNPDPPAVTTVTDKAWVYPVFGKRNDYTSITPPSGYTSAGQGSSTAGSDASAGTAYKEKTPAGSEDPPAWTLGGGASTDDGQAWTGALKPSSSNPVEQAVILWRTYDTDYESAATTISRTAFADYSEARTTNPYTGNPWTWTEVNSLQIGARASTVGASEYIQVSEFWIVVDYALGYNLNLRVMDWDLIDAIANAQVCMNNSTDYWKTSDSDGWVNYTGVSGTVTVKVQYYGFWVNGTFSVTMDSDKTIDVQCNLYDVTVLVQESIQNAYLASANVTVFNATSVEGNKITSGTTGDNGQAQLLNLPNNTLTFTQYGGASYSLLIGNATELVSSENQFVTLTSDQNNVNTNNYYSIIAVVGMTIPLKGGFVTRRLKKKRRNKPSKKKLYFDSPLQL